MLETILKYEFLQNAIIASLLAGIICGLVGVVIVEKKLLMMTGGIAHTAYGGIGLGYLLGFEPMLGAASFAVGSAFLIGKIKTKSKYSSDVIIALLWSLGMASGILFTSLMPTYPPDINAYLFGNLLSVSKQDILSMSVLSIAILILFTIFFQDLKAYLFDDKFARINGILTKLIEYLVLTISSLCIVMLIRIVGIILVIALIAAPASVSALLTKRLSSRMIVSALFCTAFCLSGLFISYTWDISCSAAIVFISALSYFIILAIKKIKSKN